MRSWGRAAAAALLVACAQSPRSGTPPPVPAPSPGPGPAAEPAPPPAPPKPPAHHKPPDVVRYGPSATRYVITRRFRLQQSFGESPEVQDLGARLFVSVAISGPADAGRYPTIFTLDSIVPDSGTPESLAGTLAKMRGQVFTGRLSPVGEFEGAAASDTTASMTQFVPNFRDFLPRIPAAGVKLGSTWTDTLVMTQRSAGGNSMSRRAIVRSIATAWDDRGGAPGLRIETATTYEVKGTGNSGVQFQLSGTGAGTGRLYLGEDGRFTGGEARDSLSFSVTVTAQGATIPTIQITQSTVAVRP